MEGIEINPDNMSLTEAIVFSFLTGKSVVHKRYSKEAKENVQFYVYKSYFYIDGGDCKKACLNSYISDIFEVYKGNKKQFHKIIEEKLDKYKKLKREVEPIYSKVKEFIALEDELREWI